MIKKRTALSLLSRKGGKSSVEIQNEIKKIQNNYEGKIAQLDSENANLALLEADLGERVEFLRDMQGSQVKMEEDSLISWMSGPGLGLGKSRVSRVDGKSLNYDDINSDIESLDISDFSE
jgi:hypothetical protein